MSRHHDEHHRGCEAVAASTSRLDDHSSATVTSSGHVLSDTDSGVADTDETSVNPRRPRNTGARPKVSSSSTASATASTSSNVDLQTTLRDPSHYEELNVIGNGKIFFLWCQKIMRFFDVSPLGFLAEPDDTLTPLPPSVKRDHHHPLPLKMCENLKKEEEEEDKIQFKIRSLFLVTSFP